jgi:hypothetical protein
MHRSRRNAADPSLDRGLNRVRVELSGLMAHEVTRSLIRGERGYRPSLRPRGFRSAASDGGPARAG